MTDTNTQSIRDQIAYIIATVGTRAVETHHTHAEVRQIIQEETDKILSLIKGTIPNKNPHTTTLPDKNYWYDQGFNSAIDQFNLNIN